MWGDPRHALSEPFVIGQPAPVFDGIFPRPADKIATLTKTYGTKLQSYCNFADRFCASGALSVNAITLRNYSDVIHEYSYLFLGVQPAVKFISDQTQ